MNITRSTTIALASAAALVLVAAGCGDDDDAGDAAEVTTAETNATTARTDAAATTAETTAVPPSTGAAPATTDAGRSATTGGGDAQAVEVVMSDYAFSGLPESVPAGTRLSITNISDKEFHELIALRIPDDEQRPVEEIVQLPEAEVGAIFGDAMPATVLLAPPGGDQIDAVGDGTLSEPGRYAIVCFIPTGADPEAYMQAAREGGDGPPQVDGGPPHIVHGMAAELVVE